MMRFEAVCFWISPIILVFLLSLFANQASGWELFYLILLAIIMTTMLVRQGIVYWNKPRVRKILPKLKDLDYKQIFLEILRYELAPILGLLTLVFLGAIFFTYKDGNAWAWKYQAAEIWPTLIIFVGGHLSVQLLAILSIRRRFHTTLGRIWCTCRAEHDGDDNFFSFLYLTCLFVLWIGMGLLGFLK